jgi:hypothetical protein
MTQNDSYILEHYDEIMVFINSQIADELALEAYYKACEQALYEDLAYYNWARQNGYE